MESPPSSSTWSEAFILSDDSGLLLTSGSISSGSMSSCYPGLRPIEVRLDALSNACYFLNMFINFEKKMFLATDYYNSKCQRSLLPIIFYQTSKTNANQLFCSQSILNYCNLLETRGSRLAFSQSYCISLLLLYYIVTCYLF